MSNPSKSFLVLSTAVLLLAARASAVIQVKMPVSRIYRTSKAVYVGTVAKVTPASRLVDVAVTGALRGESPGKSIRIQILSPVGLISKVAAKAPVAVFVGKARGGAMAILHLADTWLLAKRAGTSTPQIWRVVQSHNAKQTFPGRTSALVRVVKEIAAGKSPILDSTDVAFFRSPLRKIAKLNVTDAKWILTGDVNRDRAIDLIIGTDRDVRLLADGKEGFVDVTEKYGLKSGPVAWRGIFDLNGDNRSDLILGDTIWISSEGKFKPEKLPPAATPAGDKPLAITANQTSPYSSRRRARAYFLSSSGRLQLFERLLSGDKGWTAAPVKQLWPADSPATAAEFGNFGDSSGACVLAVRPDGVMRYPLDSDKAPQADFERLTGVNLKKYYERYAEGFRNPLAIGLDVNGDRRRDLLIVCDTGGMLMVNRGYGAFLCDYDSGGEIAPHPKKPPKLKLTAQTPWTAVDLHRDGQDDLLILTADGTLYEASNKPRKVDKK